MFLDNSEQLVMLFSIYFLVVIAILFFELFMLKSLRKNALSASFVTKLLKISSRLLIIFIANLYLWMSACLDCRTYMGSCVEPFQTGDYPLIEAVRQIASDCDTSREIVHRDDPGFSNYIFLISKALDEKDPFQTLPKADANTLSRLKQGIESENKIIALDALAQIAKSIQERDAELKKQSKSNAMSITTGVVGVATTIISLVVSIVLAFML